MTLEAQFLNPTEIGRELEKITGNKISGMQVNRLLQAIQLQCKVANVWEPTILGQRLSVILPYTGKNNHSGFQLKWSTDVIELLKRHLEPDIF
ncbi:MULTISPECIES: hypothetical protein [unclassified Nostoc]|uniref:hypothetical protein n=1 Tax=unclassified Nostoc TaxID=2593658 RepID=UPI002AD2F15C|nr:MULTISPECIES: hypothetical protein [unclassified Nostoc]MDZ8031998.1 hypothetical protein [Nostoc sp. DedSLP04]MDZ8131636.1 hypothetical protein [Nostoc sp. DedQUE07]